jgi:transposase
MPVMDERCAGLDGHQKTVGACVVTPGGPETRTFGTMPAERLALADGLLACGCPHGVIASTGDDWKPGVNSLEGTGEGLLVHAQHAKAVPGRKTDVNAAAWLAARLRHGLWRARGMPPMAQRARRDLACYRRTLRQARVTLIQRGQQRLEEATITLAAVASALMGGSGRATRAALLTGPVEPQALAELAQGRLRRTRDQCASALEGRVKPHHRCVWTELLRQIDRLGETIARVAAPIQALCGPVEEAVARWETMPGVARRTAEVIDAEIGTDMTRLPRADHLASWASVAPGTHESAGQRASGKTRKGQRCLRTTLAQAAHAAARTRGP